MKKLFLIIVAALSLTAISTQASARCYTWWENGVKYRNCDSYYYGGGYYDSGWGYGHHGYHHGGHRGHHGHHGHHGGHHGGHHHHK